MKKVYTEKVEQMKITEKELVNMYEELERVRAEVAVKKANVLAPYGGPSHPLNGDGYMDSYCRPHHVGGGSAGDGTVPLGSGASSGVNCAWGGSNEVPHNPK